MFPQFFCKSPRSRDSFTPPSGVTYSPFLPDNPGIQVTTPTLRGGVIIQFTVSYVKRSRLRRAFVAPVFQFYYFSINFSCISIYYFSDTHDSINYLYATVTNAVKKFRLRRD